MNYNFFSFVIPAHNEEALIGQTLDFLKNLNYPRDKYEVIVVENGSNDRTFEKAKDYQSDNFKIFSSNQKGVSKARNFGISKCSNNFDWAIMMDADTFIKKDFLSELNDYLNKNNNVAYGTTTLTPDTQTFESKFWFGYRNITDRMFKILHVIHIVKRDLLALEKYDEELTIMEDVNFGRSLSKHGKYFFLKTSNVITSARRFEQKGYIKMFFINIYIGLLPKKVLKRKEWGNVR
jgi:glycosyltransferase involved in cell wall biosynthesis